ncbi:MAG: hypothetical protein RDV41_01585, partial [Planctomycetota bacterium]|nr:hypothetical protein [Planctomycetota bacterium]
MVFQLALEALLKALRKLFQVRLDGFADLREILALFLEVIEPLLELLDDPAEPIAGPAGLRVAAMLGITLAPS